MILYTNTQTIILHFVNYIMTDKHCMVRQIDFKRYAKTYAKSATNVSPMWQKNVSHTSFATITSTCHSKSLSVVFCKESRMRVGKKIVTNKELKYLFYHEFQIKLARNNPKEIRVL